MAYIYQITNKINNKIYVGKTEFSIEKRFKEHCNDAFREKNKNRPLYRAMRKYGIENFEISLLEETNNPNEREVYWIEKKGSFKYGYNATIGGDGKKYLDYDLIISEYSEIQNITLTAKKLNISPDSVRDILKHRNIDIKPSSEIAKEKLGKTIKMFNLNNEYLQTFSTVKDAARYLVNNGFAAPTTALEGITTHIRGCANLKRKTAYKHIWKWN